MTTRLGAAPLLTHTSDVYTDEFSRGPDITISIDTQLILTSFDQKTREGLEDNFQDLLETPEATGSRCLLIGVAQRLHCSIGHETWRRRSSTAADSTRK